VDSGAANHNEYPFGPRIAVICNSGRPRWRSLLCRRWFVLAYRNIHYHLGLEKTETAEKAVGYAAD
jgi:hypothetical protein